jgi:hypothetical protein
MEFVPSIVYCLLHAICLRLVLKPVFDSGIWQVLANTPTLCFIFTITFTDCGARGGVVVKALRYKPAGRGFDS